MIIESNTQMHGLKLRQGLALTLLAATGVAFGAPNAAVMKAVKAEQKPLEDTLKTLVNIDSGTGDTKGLGQIQQILIERLKADGVEVQTHLARAYGGNTIVGRMKGSGDQNIMLMIHYDTVFDRGTAEKRPYRVANGLAYGPGVADAKGGVAVILHTLDALRTLGYDEYGQLTVVFNPDEEKGSMGSRELIGDLAAQQDAVLVYEPSFGDDGQDAVTIVTKGINYPSLEVSGRSSHAGSAPEQGRNAVMELSHQILQLSELGDAAKNTTLNWTVVDGGTKRNVIPDHAEARGDMRYFDASEYQRVKNDANRIVENKLIEDTTVEFKMTRGRPPMPDNPQTRALADIAQSIYAELDKPLAAVKIGGGTDAGYAYQGGGDKPAVIESLGLVGGRYHSADEFAVMGSIVPRLYLSTRMVMALSERE